MSMTSLFAKKARLESGWARDVRVDIDADGVISAVTMESVCTSDQPSTDLLIPAMPNLHSHAFQRAMAGLAEVRGSTNDSFWTWRKLMYDLANRITPEDLEAIASQLYMELLKGGTSSIAEFHYIHRNAPNGKSQSLEMAEALMHAATKTGMRLTLLPVLYQVSGFGENEPQPEQQSFCHNTDQFISLLESLEIIAARNPNTQIGIAFHSLRAVAPEAMSNVLAWRKENHPSWPVHIHIAEQTKEVADCETTYGKRPVEWLLDSFEVDEHWCLVHATHMSAQELETLARTGAVAGICPTTEANLGDGFFDFTPWLAAGGRYGIGSDSNISTRACEELRWLDYGARLRERRRLIAANETTPNAGAALWMAAASGGAQALGIKAGCIAPGYRADFLGLDGQAPFPAWR